MRQIFGDSISTKSIASGASSVPAAYASRLETAIGQTVGSVAVSGAMAADQAPLMYAVNPQEGDKFVVMLGTNDERVYGDSSPKLVAFRRIVQGMCAYLGTVQKRDGFHESIAYTGSWGSTAVYGKGRNSFTQGNHAAFTISGTAVYLWLIAQQNAPGVAEIRVDGVLRNVWSTDQPLTTGLGATFCPSFLRVGGLLAGDHAVEVRLISPTNAAGRVYIDLIAGNVQSAKPDVYLVNIPRAQAYLSGGSNANVATYNAELAAIAAELAGDGLNVHLIDVCNLLYPASDMDGGYHPINQGHVKISDALYTAMTGDMSFTPTEVFRGSDGCYYVGEGAERKRLATS